MANQFVNKLIKDGVTKFDLTSDTVTPETLKSGYTAHNAAGQKITGTMTVSEFIASSAINSDNNTHNVEDYPSTNISDTISYYNFTPNITYTIKTKVYNSTQDTYLTITKSGTSATEITSSVTPTTTDGTYINAFVIDCQNCDDGDVLIVYENVYKANITKTGHTSTLNVLIPTVELGLRADFRNSTFTRLGDAIGLNGGNDFDNFPMYKRRRCNLANNGTVNAYLGGANYAIDGTNGQVMVEQPRFYYKVVPVSVKSNKLLIAEYWICNKQLDGYKLHPAFKNTSGNEIYYFYEGAYEGSVSDSKLCSISGVTPSDTLTRADFRTYAANRGSGWRQETIWSLSADQLLMIIEYGMFNMQSAIGNGNSESSSYLSTGTLNSYGNGSYGDTINKITAVQWRGKENPWGNKSAFIDGINIRYYKDPFSPYIYIANSYSFIDDDIYHYSKISFSPNVYNRNYISAFGYDANFDWLFIPIECDSTYGNSSVPVGDYIFGGGSQGWRVYANGGAISYDTMDGPFLFDMNWSPDSSYGTVGSRLLYVG